MPASAAALERWLGATTGPPDPKLLTAVRHALDRDLDTPAAVALIDEAVTAGIDVTAPAALLGIHLTA